jgi:nicotinamidase/pyrazinamidase
VATMSTAIIIVDVQRDFCSGGTLSAFDTESLIVPLGQFIVQNRRNGNRVIFTQDWHPPDHHSFSQSGGPWPIHCVAGSAGAALDPGLSVSREDWFIHKGTSAEENGYSAFEATGLADRLKTFGIGRLAVCGIATEYCVRTTAIAAAVAGFDTAVICDLTRPVKPEAPEAVFRELAEWNVKLSDSITWNPVETTH